MINFLYWIVSIFLAQLIANLLIPNIDPNDEHSSFRGIVILLFIYATLILLIRGIFYLIFG